MKKIWVGLLLPLVAGVAYAAETIKDGTVHVPAFDLPLSTALSPEARAYFGGTHPSPPPETYNANSDESYIAEQRAYYAKFDAGFGKTLARDALSRYPVTIKEMTIGGVPVESFEPAGGVAPANRRRVLISLRGGNFGALGSHYINQTASVPVASIGGIRVVSVVHRPSSFKFPSASVDVADVYRALLKTYPARNIGIYGCSAGGVLTGQAVAWMIDKKVPLPGAVAVLGIGLQSAIEKPTGDAIYYSAIAEGGTPPAPGAAQPGFERIFGPYGYFSTAALTDRLVDPLLDPTLLAKFPPTMLMTGTRAFDMSHVIATQRALEKAGVETSLQMFDGTSHCFYAIPSLPESRAANAAIYRFFDRRLGR